MAHHSRGFRAHGGRFWAEWCATREVRDIARITHLSCAYSTPTKLSEGLPLTAPLTYSFIPARTQTTWALFATPETPLKTCAKEPGSAPMDTRTLAPGAHWPYTYPSLGHTNGLLEV